MKVLVSGHRQKKLAGYDLEGIYYLLDNAVYELKKKYGFITGLSGMANGIDLVFCQKCLKYKVPFYACPPFEEQDEYMDVCEKALRTELLEKADKIYKIRNSQMLEMAEFGIIVWDGNKGGTHNVFQQMLEAEKPFIWIEPKSLKLYEIG